MAKTKLEKKKAKRKAKQKQRREKITQSIQREKEDYFLYQAVWEKDAGNFDKALFYFEKALRLNTKNEELLRELADTGYQMDRPDVELKGLMGLYNNGFLENDNMPALCQLMLENGKYEQALHVAEETLLLLPKMDIRNKKRISSEILKIQKYCRMQLEHKEIIKAYARTKDDAPQPSPETGKTSPPIQDSKHGEVHVKKASLQEIPISVEVDSSSFTSALTGGEFTTTKHYELALEGHRIRFNETFDNLICLYSLKDIRSLWYQEETARKILKTFRGRALLSDEVGLGKTIEALIVFKEYVQRGMVKTALILTPTTLVSQWKEELSTKFGFDIPSTDDADYRLKGSIFWKSPFILSSINLAKSKKNFNTVIGREYDMIIVDEAHHLKNRNTLNWKLVNALKKRFLLLITATPVENNLMELYNLITLLKPGQLKTASAFRKEFMTRGDPTDPQNRSKLKELLGQVMIRNTRALAKVDIPPRFAQTIKVDSNPSEQMLYKKIDSLVNTINKINGSGHKLLLKNLLEEAGSSPKAVSLTLSRLLSKKDLFSGLKEEIWTINNLCCSMDDTRKNKLLLKLIKSSPGKKIIFVKFLGTLEYVSDFLEWQKIPHAVFHGSMNNRKKDEQIMEFKKEKDILLTTEIGGEGRNLQFCHQMINYDLPWNPMKIEQRIGRIHRIGQEKEVMIYNLCAAGSVEDYILEVLDKKINMFEMVIGEIDMIMGRISGERQFSEMVFDIWMNSLSEEEKEKSFGRLASSLKRSKTLYEKTKALDDKLFGENYEL